ncbi:hypothetical protein RND81_02G187200 [Saponaria officinalis]|uniref:Uncharacterized protein n=1 Tax=Saponaria officinalis TaxID=3572 RepID=A0AAW1MUX0_SAPOF
MDAPPSHKKRSRVDSAATESPPESTKVKRIRDDLLSLLDDFDTVPDRDPLSHDLDSVIRSFQEEISGSKSGSASPTPDTVEPGPEVTESVGIGEFLWEFEGGLPSYDPFEFGLDYEESVISGDVDNSQVNGNEYVALDGLFDYPDLGFGLDLSWRSETLPALR